MAVYQVETDKGVYEVETEDRQPMFKTEAEGRAQLAKDKSFQNQAAFEASPVGFPVTQGLTVANRAINTATFNAPEIIANKFGQTTRPITESDIARSTGDAIGFIAPTGSPMRVIKAAEIIRNPLTRSVVQGAGAMTTQLPTDDRGVGEYAGGIAAGGAFGVAGRGVEKVAGGAIQQGAKATAGRIHDYLVKLPVGAFKFGKNPIKVAADESIVAGSMAEYEQIAAQRLAERSAQLEGAVQLSNKTVDVSEMVDKHLNDASRKLTGSLKDRTAKIEELNTVRQNLEAQYGDLKQLKVQDAIKLKRQLADDFPFTQENAGDITTKSAHKIYHDINKFVEEAHPEIADLNERVSGLIDIKNAARNRNAVESRNNPLGLVARLGASGALIGGAAMGHTPEGIISALGIMGAEKAMQSPAVLTRVAKALSMMSMDGKTKVFAAIPGLKARVAPIKVDARDIEVIPGFKTDSSSSTGLIPRRQSVEMADVLPPEAQKQVGTPIRRRKALPNLPAEKQGFKSGNETIVPYANRKVPTGENKVIPMGESVTPERMPIADLESHIQRRYKAGASQKEIDALETLYEKRISGQEVPYPKKKAAIDTKKSSTGTPIPSSKKIASMAAGVAGGTAITSRADAKERKADKHGYYNYNLSPKESIYKDGDEIKETEASTYGWGEKLSDTRFDGKPFNADDSFIAMRGIPMGSTVEITDKKTGKKIQVEVLDGGPHRRLDRKVDLSKGAWKKLGYNKEGLTNVSVKVIKLGQGRVFAQKKAIQKNKEK